MIYRRGDVLLALYPFAAGTGHSRRPVLVVQSDRYNAHLDNTVVAQITSNLTHASDPAHLVEISISASIS
jgi:mRNA-degrading endonuclease toxin of MazEF toxin-antitoxin module